MMVGTMPQVDESPRRFEHSDFDYLEDELPPDLFKAVKSTFVGKPVPQQSISNERLRELGGDYPDELLWLRYCTERKLSYW